MLGLASGREKSNSRLLPRIKLGLRVKCPLPTTGLKTEKGVAELFSSCLFQSEPALEYGETQQLSELAIKIVDKNRPLRRGESPRTAKSALELFFFLLSPGWRQSDTLQRSERRAVNSNRPQDEVRRESFQARRARSLQQGRGTLRMYGTDTDAFFT